MKIDLTKLKMFHWFEDEEGNVSENTYVVREGIVRQVSIYSSKIWRGTTRIDGVCYSVRCVKDAN